LQLPNFTVSFGIASSDEAEHFHEVVLSADEALLNAKGVVETEMLSPPIWGADSA